MDYNFLYIWTGLLLLVFIKYPSGYLSYDNGYYQKKTKKIFAYMAIVPIILFVVTATNKYWIDYGVYISNYKYFPTNFNEAYELIVSTDNRSFFYAFTYLVKVIFDGNVFAYRIILALFQTLPIIYMLRKYSVNYLFSLYLFLAFAIPLAWMLNGVRQLCAASIIYGATQLYIDKKYIKSLLMILLATMFHQTAILMIAFVYICQGRAWNKKTIVCIVSAVFFVIFISRLSGVFDFIMEEAGYNVSYFSGDDGVHPLRVLVHLVPPVMAYIGRARINEEGSPAINFCVNMSIVTLAIYLVAMVTNGILVGRVPLYTSLYNFILLPYLIDLMFKGKNRQLIYLLAIILFYLFYLVQYGL